MAFKGLLVLIVATLVTFGSGIRVLESQVKLGDDRPTAFSGARLVPSDPNARIRDDLTICTRFNYRTLGHDSRLWFVPPPNSGKKKV